MKAAEEEMSQTRGTENLRATAKHNAHGEVHANIWGLKFYVNQYLGSANYNMDKIQYLGYTNLKEGQWEKIQKEESWDLVRVSKIFDSIFGVPKTFGSIFGGQKGNIGIDRIGIES